jgi:hypothetical protein
VFQGDLADDDDDDGQYASAEDHETKIEAGRAESVVRDLFRHMRS